MSRSTVQLLRFHFSIFLLPVFLFGLSEVRVIDWQSTIYAFFILHVLVYPSSNGYNSYMDRDTTAIGGLANPMQPTKELFVTSIILDVVAVFAGLLVSKHFAAGVLLYILASRAYSWRGIRLKKYAIAGYLIVILFQGSLIFFLSYHACSTDHPLTLPLNGMLAAAALIGGSYPLTQVYQHEADAVDGVHTISMLFGRKGTFIFSGLVFLLATFCMFWLYYNRNDLSAFYIFVACMLPMVWFFVLWIWKVWRNEQLANFKNSLIMNILASLCTTIFFHHTDHP